MSLIVLTVKESLGRWAVMHAEQALATFDTCEEAERAAMALAAAHPPKAAAELDVVGEDGAMRSIQVL